MGGGNLCRPLPAKFLLPRPDLGLQGVQQAPRVLEDLRVPVAQDLPPKRSKALIAFPVAGVLEVLPPSSSTINFKGRQAKSAM